MKVYESCESVLWYSSLALILFDLFLIPFFLIFMCVASFTETQKLRYVEICKTSFLMVFFLFLLPCVLDVHSLVLIQCCQSYLTTDITMSNVINNRFYSFVDKYSPWVYRGIFSMKNVDFSNIRISILTYVELWDSSWENMWSPVLETFKIIYNSNNYCTILILLLHIITYDLLLHVSTLIRHFQGAFCA